MQTKLIERLQDQLRHRTAERDAARQEATDWQQRAEAIHAAYQELCDQLRRGEFVKARRVRVCE